VLAFVLVDGYLLGYAFEWPTLDYYSLPVAATYKQQLAFVAEAYGAARVLPVEPLPTSDLERVAARTCWLMFLESYGAITYDSAEVSAIVAPERAGLRPAIDADGGAQPRPHSSSRRRSAARRGSHTRRS
jgi:hypothetical protein